MNKIINSLNKLSLCKTLPSDEFLSIKFNNNNQERVLINWKFRENTQKASTPRETHSLGF